MTDTEKAELIETLIDQRDAATHDADWSRAICDVLTRQLAAANADAAAGWYWARFFVRLAPRPTGVMAQFDIELNTHNARIDGTP